MLPTEKIELAIYRRIKAQSHSPVPIPASLQMFMPDAGHDAHAIAEAILGLEAERHIRLSKYVGRAGPYRYEDLDETISGDFALKQSFLFSEFRIEITPKGRKHFEELEFRDQNERREPVIFISCGQYYESERQLGAGLENLVHRLIPPYKAYFAQNQTSLQALSDHIFRALDRCAGLVAVMHKRGVVDTPSGKQVRGSVWVEQEIAIAAFITATRSEIPVVLYIEKGIKREGVREFIMSNTFEFTTEAEVLEDFESRLKNGRFEPQVPQ